MIVLHAFILHASWKHLIIYTPEILSIEILSQKIYFWIIKGKNTFCIIMYYFKQVKEIVCDILLFFINEKQMFHNSYGFYHIIF